MNRNLTLILSAVLVFVLLGIWVYIMFFADNQADQGPVTETGEFADFDGLEGGELLPGQVDENGQPVSGTGDGTETINLDGEYDPAILRQLTTRNVAGYGELIVASTTYIMYMESGVGHIYGIDLGNGVEERISATTIPDTREAAFSPLAPVAAVKAGPGVGTNSLLLATIDVKSQTVTTEAVAEAVDQFAFLADGSLVFSTLANNAVVVTRYDPETQETTALFSTPFREARVVFGSSVSGPHYFYPKTSSQLQGFVYVYDDGALRRLPPSGFGLSALGGKTGALITVRDGRAMTSVVAPLTGNEPVELAVVTLPDKCVAGEAVFYCGVPRSDIKIDSTDEWNKGAINYSDVLWSIATSGSESLIDIAEFSGRQVDVIKSGIGPITNDWYFQSKRGNTLWVYELSRLTETVATSSTVTESEL